MDKIEDHGTPGDPSAMPLSRSPPSMMRSRSRILDSLETAYRDGLRRAEERGDAREAARLELDFVRDQLQLEVLLDLRDLLTPTNAEDPRPGSGVGDILDTAQKLRNLTRLR